MRKILYKTIIILLIGTMLISSYFIYKNIKEDKEQEKIFKQVFNIVQINNDIKYNKQKAQKNNIDIEKLYKINNDIVGWLQINNTNINYPIMQTKNKPNFYLRKNFYKEYSRLGTPFLDENCDIKNSNNLIIYGHNIDNLKMFGELENYKKEEFYKKHKFIKFYTKEEKEEFEIISVFKTIAYTGFEYYNFKNINNESEFNTFIQKCNELSFYNTGKKANLGDKFITLSTCDYTSKNARLVIIAKKYYRGVVFWQI